MKKGEIYLHPIFEEVEVFEFSTELGYADVNTEEYLDSNGRKRNTAIVSIDELKLKKDETHTN